MSQKAKNAKVDSTGSAHRWCPFCDGDVAVYDDGRGGTRYVEHHWLDASCPGSTQETPESFQRNSRMPSVSGATNLGDFMGRAL